MDWFQQVNNYCERTDFSYWSEPVNALTNAAFLVGAVYAWRLASKAGDRGGQVLSVIMALIGMGSYLLHTHAQMWAMMADTTPILVFILVYVYLGTVRFFECKWWIGLATVIAFFPYSAGVVGVLRPLVGDLNGSLGYVPVPILISAYALVLWKRRPETARGLMFGVAVLSLSLVFRSVDNALCEAIPFGTHFMWHPLNAIMLAWMIKVLVENKGARPAG